MSNVVIEPAKNYRWQEISCTNFPLAQDIATHKCDVIFIVVIQEPVTNSVRCYHISSCQLAKIVLYPRCKEGEPVTTLYERLQQWEQGEGIDRTIYEQFFGRCPLVCVSTDPFYPYTQCKDKVIVNVSLPLASTVRHTIYTR